MSKQVRANLLLLLTAFIWGAAFVAQDVAMDTMGPFTFNSVRSFVAALALLPCICLLDRVERRHAAKTGAPAPLTFRTMSRAQRKTLVLGGVCCGVALFVASSFQQLGIQQSTAGKSGFVTALYIVLVPLTGLFVGRRVRLNVWVAVSLCTVGLFLLCVTESFTLGPGDGFLLLCAAGFTVHILVIDHFSPKTDGVRMSCIQFLTVGILSGAVTLFTESPSVPALLNGWLPILYAGMFSSAVGYTLQIVAQRDTDPAVASLLMCLESVFAVLAGWVILGEQLSPRELGGCALMMVGIVLAQVPPEKLCFWKKSKTVAG